MRYDDLLNVPYKPHGRDGSGYDCYGLCLEMCRRAGTPLRDMQGDLTELSADRVSDYIGGGMNVREIPAPKVGALAYSVYGGNIHIGYIVERGKMLHATTDKGVRVSPLAIMKPVAYYEVVNESDTVREAVEREEDDRD